LGKDYRNYQREGIGGHASPKRCGERDSDPSLFSCVVSGDQYLYLSRGRIFQHGKPLLGSFQAHACGEEQLAIDLEPTLTN
jgi:hypothetical protein